MSDYDSANHTEQDQLVSDLTSQYSEACQSFVLRDFDTTTGIVNDLLERIEQGENLRSDESSNNNELEEVVRRVWILYITLVATADEELAGNPKQAESELAGAHSRIQQFYARTTSSDSTSSSSSTSSSTTLIHPSLLVALSLAGLKLEMPLFVRRTLQDYFRLLLSDAANSEEQQPLATSQGDISALEVSHADLSLSGIAVNGHAPNHHQVNGTNGHSVNGEQATGNTATSNRKKSLHRLSRIYSVHLLGKSLGEWSNARAWIREMADDDAAVTVGLMSDSYAQTLLESLEETKVQQEEEEREARQAEKTGKARQAELKNSKKSTSSSSQQASSSSSSGFNGQTSSSSPPPMRPERNKDRTNGQNTSGSALPRDQPQEEEQETGFAAFRSHLSTFLSSTSTSSSSLESSSSSSPLAKRPTAHLTHHNSNTSLDLIRIYLSRFVHSKILKLLLAFFIITGFWRRRLGRRGTIRLDVGKRLGLLKDKIMETVKMGGSLGFL